MNSTERRLMIVTNIVKITGRGIAAWPVVPHELICSDSGERLKPGDPVELRRPDGIKSRVQLHSLEWPSPNMGGLILMFGASVTAEEIPFGTEIWTVKT